MTSSIGFSQSQEIAFRKYIAGNNIFITGPGGTGKSELIRAIVRHSMNCIDKHIQVCAMTGCAAVLLNCKAMTLHSWSGIGIRNLTIDEFVYKVSKNYSAKSRWRNTQVLIVDEVSMMSKKMFETLNAIGKSIRKNSAPFGGIQVIFSGDFYQLPPIGDKTDEDLAQFCFQSSQWFDVFPMQHHVVFDTNFRQLDKTYSRLLNNIRRGRITRSEYNLLTSRCNQSLPSDALIRPTKLFPIRSSVERVNTYEMEKLDSAIIHVYKVQFHTNLGTTSAKPKYTPQQINDELAYIMSNLRCDEECMLKLGAQVMCIQNIDLEIGLCNGSQGIIVRFEHHVQKIIEINGFNITTTSQYPVVRFTNGHEMIMLPYVWTSDNIPDIGVSQIPLVLAWALTIHKSQGATLDLVEIDAGNSIFECGQTYVALSRVKQLNGLYLSSFDLDKIKINPIVADFYATIENYRTATTKDATENAEPPTDTLPVKEKATIVHESRGEWTQEQRPETASGPEDDSIYDGETEEKAEA